MKDRVLIYISLLVSILAITYAAWIHEHAEQIAAEALRQREVVFVGRLAPKMRIVYSDMLGRTNIFVTEPRTIEELFQPVLSFLDTVGESPDAERKPDTHTMTPNKPVEENAGHASPVTNP